MRATAIALLALSVAARAGVLVVSGDDVAVQAAINAASDGDIILIKPGTAGDYGELIVDGKSLTLVVDGGDYDVSHLIVRNLAADGLVVVRGLSVASFTFDSPLIGPDLGALEVRDCAGAVWIDDCTIAAPWQFGGFSGLSYPGLAGLVAVNSQSVTVSDSTLTGGSGAPEEPYCTPGTYLPATEGGPGVSALGSRVALLGVTATGGLGGWWVNFACSSHIGGPGGPGLRADAGSIVHASGCSFAGAPDTDETKQAGSGLVLGTGSVTLRDSTAVAGAGGPPVPAVVQGSGTLLSSSVPARGLAVSSPLRAGAQGSLDIEAEAGDTVGLFQSAAGGWQPVPFKEGVFLLGPPSFGPVFLATHPGGVWSVPVTAPPLPAGTLGQSVLLQLLVKRGPKITVEDVATCTLLDASVP